MSAQLKAIRPAHAVQAFVLVALTLAGPACGQESAEGLKRLIHESLGSFIPTTPAPRAGSEDLYQWSSSVNDLACRVEYARESSYSGYTVFVRVENRGAGPLRVPMGNPADAASSRIFELHVRKGADGPWQRAGWVPTERLDGPNSAAEWDGVTYPCMALGNVGDREDVVLQPGESALAYLCGSPDFESLKPTEVKIVLRRTGTGPNLWQGTLESPPFPANMSEKKFESCAGLLKAPDYLPEFNHRRFKGSYMSGMESEFRSLKITNHRLLDALDLYEPEHLRVVLERLIAAETDVPMKLLLASEAVIAGSENAALLILDSMAETDYTVVTSTHDAMKRLLYHYDRRTPPWLLAMVQNALSDERKVSGLERSICKAGTSLSVAYLADESADLTTGLGNAKCREAVPFLIELARHEHRTSGPIMALGMIGDERAIPPLIEILGSFDADGNPSGWSSRHKFLRAVRALGELKASEAVPILLAHLRYGDVIEALDDIGDPCALPALQQLVASEGRIEGGSTDQLDETESRLVAAKIAVASLDPTSRTERLAELLADPSFGEFDRRTVAWQFTKHPDPKAIPVLLNLIKTDPSGAVVNQAITVMTAFRHKDAIAGLIDSFDASFEGKSDWKRAYNAKGFQRNIAASLQKLTGEDLGPEKAAWVAWWKSLGEKIDWSNEKLGEG